MKLIPLSGNGGVVMVSDSDYAVLKRYSWRSQPRRGGGLVAATTMYSPKRTVLMHRFIKSAPKHLMVDHKDRNSLNNTRKNLRLCTHRQNCMNRPMAKQNTSGYKGVFWDPRHGFGHKNWHAKVGWNYKAISAGYYATKVEAAVAYNALAKKLYGKFAVLNKI